jgi:hypothetical protein
MASEYDFLLPYSRRLRRTAAYLAGLGAVLAGAVSTALIVAVPLQPRSNSDLTFGAPVAGRSQDDVRPAAKADTTTPTGDVGAARVAEEAQLPTREADPAVATPAIAVSPSSRNIALSKPALSHLKLDESAPAASDAMPPSSRVQPPTDAASHAKLPPAAAAPPGARLGTGRSRTEQPTTSAARTRDNVTPEPQRVRPEPFSVQEFFASRRL